MSQNLALLLLNRRKKQISFFTTNDTEVSYTISNTSVVNWLLVTEVRIVKELPLHAE
jgi:hypothetical protein